MKKWPILAVTAVVLALYALFLVFWFGGGGQQAPTEPAAPAINTAPAAQTPTTEATVPTTVVTEPTLPRFSDPDESLLTAKHAFVYDLTFEQLLYTYGDQQERISPASLTKLFTCFVAMQYLQPDTVVQVGPEAGWIEPDSSIALITPGTSLTVEMIVQGAMMQSGNDAAYVLAVAAGKNIVGGNNVDPQLALEAFMAEMNRQAQAEGLAGTHFVTPDGYDAEGHYSTAADLMRIAQLAMTEPLIVRYAAVAQADVTFESGEAYTWKNTNWMLGREEFPELYCPQVTGLKTGGTSKAGMCVMATFDTGERQLLIGVLGCEKIEQRFADALLLFENYR